jgi:hypothetical protein
LSTTVGTTESLPATVLRRWEGRNDRLETDWLDGQDVEVIQLPSSHNELVDPEKPARGLSKQMIVAMGWSRISLKAWKSTQFSGENDATQA